MNYYFFERAATDDTEAGFTVSKKATLPNGDFKITEFAWPNMILWFIDGDAFSADERQGAYVAKSLTATKA